MRIEINDLLLFKYLFEENYIHIDDVLNFNLMKQNYECNKRRRLSNLKKAGYIKYKEDPFSRKNYLFPTQKAKVAMLAKNDEFKNNFKMNGNSYLKFFRPNDYTVKQDFSFNNLIHDRELTQLRFYFENIGVDYWQSESMYYNYYKKNPDAIFKIADSYYAVELEKMYKNESRYEDIFISYQKMKKMKFRSIIYITTDDFVYNKLNDLLKNIFISEISQKVWQDKIRISKFEDFRKGKFKFFVPYNQKNIDSTNVMKNYIKDKKEGKI